MSKERLISNGYEECSFNTLCSIASGCIDFADMVLAAIEYHTDTANSTFYVNWNCKSLFASTRNSMQAVKLY